MLAAVDAGARQGWLRQGWRLRVPLPLIDESRMLMLRFIFAPIVLACIIAAFAGCASESAPPASESEATVTKIAARSVTTMVATVDANGLATATFGSGCFWCGEAVFEQLEGVISAESGFSGGQVDNPSYYDVVNGKTGHAEVVQVKYDPKAISYVDLLQVFWQTHDPTTLNRQGQDIGPQYRSIILYHDDAQKQLATELLKQLDASGAFNDPIVTEIAPFENFYPADVSHQDYYARKKRNPYCQFTIVPKLKKLERVFADKLKKSGKEKSVAP